MQPVLGYTVNFTDMNLRKFSYDIDAVIGFTKEQLNEYLASTEILIIELQDQISEQIRKRRELEKDVQHLREQLTRLEAVKVDAKASRSIWKVIAGAAVAIAAVLMSIFEKNEK